MKQNAIGWFDIFVNDMDRAEAFYGAVLRRELETISDPTDTSVIMKGFVTDMECYGAGGALVKREGTEPVTGVTIVYFGVEDCAVEESRVEGAGGKIVNPKMSIGEYGFVSVCMDTEGNLFGLSSMK
ncbi:VOC family protein [Vibrio genomosp. F10]|uniref:VOC family protein n=1 Tax=Vibrio genomosp. F10 TaxID=723171 RepID=UPI0002FA63BE|nr:VOC family protein [Vibrio genomosp. F10]OEE96311.1 lactoylglutathione lyase [Vibrio genomosp. F10 str. 9ZD137]